MRAKSNTKNGKNIKTSNNNNSGKFSVKKSSKENVSTSNTKPDNSVLRPPIDTSIAGLKQAVKLFDTGTPEVVHYMTYECDVIYECRVCRNLFRSLANFISHKRVYCTRRFSHVQSSPLVEDHTILVEEDLSENNSSNALPSRITARQDLTSILQTSAAKYYKDVEEKLVSRDINRCDGMVHLQPIENTTYGVYQTVGKTDGDKLIKNQVSELHRIISKNEEAVLGPDGKVILEGGDTSGSSDQIMPEQMVVNGLICSICKLKFSSKKTLSHHTKTVHDSFRVCYSCPCCKNLFSNTWSVHRHLFKVHRKSNDQVRRLRAQIQKKQVRAEKLTEKFKKGELNKSSKEESIKDNKSWMKQLEDDSELQRCGGCGRRFERRAALISHAQTCHKRIAASNSTHSPKRKEEKINESFSDISAISSKQQSTQGTPVQKMQSEKRIGIQVRMNYCKNTVGTVTEKRRSERHKSSEDKDDDVSECASLDGLSKDRIIYQSTESVNKIKSEVIKDVEERISLCNSSVNSVSVSENSKKLVPQPNGNKVSKRLKMKRLEKMCMQLKEAAGFETTNHSKSKKGSAANSNALLNTVDLIDAEKDKISGNGSKNKISGKESIPVNNNETNAVTNGIENEIVNTCVSRTSNASRKSSISNECDEHNIDSGFSTRLKEKIVPEQFNSECKDDSVSTIMLSGKEQTVDESIFISESSEKSEPVSDKQTENEMSSQSNFEGDKSVANDSIGILTRFKVRSIFKSDNSGTDYSMVDSSDQEDLSNADESNVMKENMSEGNEDDHTNWIQKKMNRYIHFKSKQCLICLKKFKALLEIQTHVANHLGWNKFHCLFSNCTYATFLKSECTKHVMKTHLKPHEKNRAPSLVGEIGGQVKNNSCDIDFKCNFKKLNKRKKSDSEELSLDQTVLKESVGSEVELYENNSVTCISINDDSNEIVAQEFVQTSKIDSSCSEQSDIEPRFKQKLKRRKVSKVEKRMTPPIRKCSPDSTTELMEANSRASSVGAQFRNELLDAIEVKENDNNEIAMTKMEEVIECSSVLETSNNSNSDLKKDDCETQVTVLDNITEYNAEKNSKQENEQEQLINTESIDSDIQGKGRETEEEDSVQDGGIIETNMDQGNLIRMVMEVIFGGQGQVATKSETK